MQTPIDSKPAGKTEKKYTVIYHDQYGDLDRNQVEIDNNEDFNQLTLWWLALNELRAYPAWYFKVLTKLNSKKALPSPPPFFSNKYVYAYLLCKVRNRLEKIKNAKDYGITPAGSVSKDKKEEFRWITQREKQYGVYFCK